VFGWATSVSQVSIRDADVVLLAARDPHEHDQR
jgi:hypothetical protein